VREIDHASLLAARRSVIERGMSGQDTSNIAIAASRLAGSRPA